MFKKFVGQSDFWIYSHNYVRNGIFYNDLLLKEFMLNSICRKKSLLYSIVL